MPEFYRLDMPKEAINQILLTFSNNNLLDNWYFAGGGLAGQFPINQRGLRVYNIHGYCIDRWICTSAGLSVDMDGITPPSGSWMYQRLPGKILTGKTLTFSVLFADGTLLSGTNTVSGEQTIFFNFNGYVGYIESKPEHDFQPVVLYEPISRKVAAMKLELGFIRTPARKVESELKLLEYPNYVTELLKCQRYLLVVPGTESPYAVIGNGSAYTKANFSVNIPAPVPMRKLPSVQMTGNWVVRGNGIYKEFTPAQENVHIYQFGTNSVTLDIGGFPDLPAISPVELLRNNDPTASILITAEL